MNSRSIASVASALIALVLVLAPRLALADKRIVVLEFSGPKAAPFEKAIIKIVKQRHEYISSKRFTRAAKRLDDFSPDDEGVQKVATKLRAHGVLIGTVEKKKRGKFRLVLKLREGKSGGFAGEDITATVTGPRLTGAALKRVRKELLSALADLPEPAADSDDPGADSDDSATASDDAKPTEQPDLSDDAKDDTADDADDAKDDDAKDDDAKDDDAKGDDAKDDEDKDDDEAAGGDDADLAVRGRAFEGAAGLSAVGRTLDFSSEQARGYQGALVPAFDLAVEAYPMAFSKRGRKAAQNVALTLDFQKVLKISSTVMGMSGVTLPTSQQRFAIGALYRWNFGKAPTSPTLKLGIAYNKAAFTIDKTDAPDLDIPNVSYTYLSPGVELRYPFNEKIAGLGELHYFMVSGLGEVAEDTQYGGASIVAFDLDLGGEYILTPSLTLRGGFRLTRFGMTFDGSGDLTDTDGDGEQDVTSGSDRYLGFYAMVGYRY